MAVYKTVSRFSLFRGLIRYKTNLKINMYNLSFNVHYWTRTIRMYVDSTYICIVKLWNVKLLNNLDLSIFACFKRSIYYSGH